MEIKGDKGQPLGRRPQGPKANVMNAREKLLAFNSLTKQSEVISPSNSL